MRQLLIWDSWWEVKLCCKASSIRKASMDLDSEGSPLCSISSCSLATERKCHNEVSQVDSIHLAKGA